VHGFLAGSVKEAMAGVRQADGRADGFQLRSVATKSQLIPKPHLNSLATDCQLERGESALK